jgi:ABC-type transport system involved in cytochrome c biogenesis permease component
MTFLPIVERELRVAARRRSTYWTRACVAGGALLLFGGVFGILSLQRAGMGGQTGPILFSIFSWLAFISVCAAGVLLTFDSMSEEKREGTIGLLFLTDLRGYDVVLGKLLASSLQASYGLLAAFPILGITFLIGGVTGVEFWRLALVLCNTLFFSLALGVCVSTISRDAQRAMTAAVLLMLVLSVGFPVIDLALSGWDNTKFVPRLSYLSPSHGFTQAGQLRPMGLTLNLCLVHGSGWLLLGLASFLVPRAWHEKADNLSGTGSRGYRFRFGSPAKRAALRRRWLEVNPIRWLAARELWLGRFMWIFWGIMLLLAVALAVDVPVREDAYGVGTLLYYIGGFVLKLWLVSQACRFFLEGKRSGLLELLLTSPLPPAQIVRGQAWALWRRFVSPTLLLVCAQGLLIVLQTQMMMKNMARVAGTAATSATTASVFDDFVFAQIIAGAGGVVTFVTGLFALAWFGMWMGVTSKKINPAILKTLVLVDFLPAIVLTFLQGLLMLTATSARTSMWLPSLVPIIVQVLLDLVFMQVARRRLLRRFRESVLSALGVSSGGRPLTPPPLPPVLEPCPEPAEGLPSAAPRPTPGEDASTSTPQ